MTHDTGIEFLLYLLQEAKLAVCMNSVRHRTYVGRRGENGENGFQRFTVNHHR